VTATPSAASAVTMRPTMLFMATSGYGRAL